MPLPGTFSSQTKSVYCHDIYTPIMTAALTTRAELWHQPRAYQWMEREIKREIHTDLRTHTHTKPDSEGQVPHARSYLWDLGHPERTRKQRRAIWDAEKERLYGRGNEKAYSRREEYHVPSVCIGTSHGNPLVYTSERGRQCTRHILRLHTHELLRYYFCTW